MSSVKRYHQGITIDAKTKREIRAPLLKLPQESLLTKDENGVLTLLPLNENEDYFIIVLEVIAMIMVKFCNVILHVIVHLKICNSVRKYPN